MGSAGRGMVLMEHPEIVSPPDGGGPTQALFTPPSAVSTALNFTITCQHFSHPTHCITSHEVAIASLLPGMYTRLQYQLGCAIPRLRSRIETMGVSPDIYNPLGYQAYIEPHDYGDCVGAAGYYEPYESRLALCLNPAVGLDSNYEQVLIHEYFRALEYGCPAVMSDLWDDIEEDWVIEGMAQSSEESAAGSEMFRSLVGGWVELHKVDVKLTSDAGDDEYFAQDFWVHYGQANGKDITYLQDVLTLGTFAGDIVDALGDGEYLGAYFDWAKYQVMEASIDFEGALVSPCELETDVVNQAELLDFDFNTIETQFIDIFLGPLDSVVISVTFGHNYDGAAGYVFPDIQAQQPDAGLALEHKFYKEGEGGCVSIPDGDRIYENVQPSDTYYVLISNTDYNAYYVYRLGFEVWSPPTSE